MKLTNAQLRARISGILANRSRKMTWTEFGHVLGVSATSAQNYVSRGSLPGAVTFVRAMEVFPELYKLVESVIEPNARSSEGSSA